MHRRGQSGQFRPAIGVITKATNDRYGFSQHPTDEISDTMRREIMIPTPPAFGRAEDTAINLRNAPALSTFFQLHG